MRVLMLNNEFPPLGGGTGTVNEALLKRLASVADIEIDLVTSAVGRQREEIELAAHVKIIRLPVPNDDIHHASNRALVTFAACAYREAVRRHSANPYDLCLAWSAVPAGAAALAVKRLAGLPYLVRVSGPDIPGFERRYAWLYPLLRPIIRATWRGAERVVAKCARESSMIRDVDSAIDVSIVPNGVDVGAFPLVERPKDGPLRLLCVARLIERKGQHHLLQALRQLTDAGIRASVELVGTGDALKSLKDLTSSLHLEGIVSFAGYVPRAAIGERYAAADVFVLPSYSEGMSVATLEAMAAGLPVVTTRVGGAEDLVSEGINGLTFAWGDTRALVAHLSRLARDRDLVRSMGNASRLKAGAFSWDAMTRAYVEMFQAVLSDTCRKAPAQRAASF